MIRKKVLQVILLLYSAAICVQCKRTSEFTTPPAMPGFKIGKMLASEDFSISLDNWTAEGDVTEELINNKLFFRADTNSAEKPYQKGNIWWNVNIQSPYVLEYDYQSLTDKGLSMIFWNAFGLDGRDVLSWERSGLYEEYINDNLHAYHVSYHRFGSGLSNIRKAPGFHLVASTDDPIPPSDRAVHRIKIATAGNRHRIFVDDHLLHDFIDESKPCMNDKEWEHEIPCPGTGDVPLKGAIGIRHTQKQEALYDNFRIYRLTPEFSDTKADEAMVEDNSDAGFSMLGASRAVFSPHLPGSGRYRVYIKWVASRAEDRASNARFVIKNADGEQGMRVDLTDLEQAGKWFLLGEYAFEEGKESAVILTNDADNSVVADAVMFLRLKREGI